MGSPLLQLLVALSLLVVSRGAGCDCGFGTVVNSTPPCTCQCDATYSLPQCLFHETDIVPLYAVVNTTKADFVSDTLLKAISLGMGIDATKVSTQTTFFYRGTAYDSPEAAKYPNYIVVQVGVRGSSLNDLLRNVSSAQAWVTDGGIITMYLNPAATNTGDRSLVEATIYDNGQVIVMLGSLYWFIGAIVVCVVLCCCEKWWLDCECRCMPCKGAPVDEGKNGCMVAVVVGEPSPNEPVKGELPPTGYSDDPKEHTANGTASLDATRRTGKSEPASLNATRNSRQPTEPIPVSAQESEIVVGDAVRGAPPTDQRRVKRISRREKTAPNDDPQRPSSEGPTAV